MRLICLSINFHTAPLEAREAVCLDESGQRAILNHLKSSDNGLEAIVLCTCNRTEVYINCPNSCNPHDLIDNTIFDVKSSALIPWRQYRQIIEGKQAVEHLFNVAAGLDSQMLGENQIVHQLKDAYSLSIECGMSQFLFHKLLHATFRVSKAVRQGTKITGGAVSLNMAAIEKARTQIRLSGADVLVVGAGENAALLAKYLQKEIVGKLTIASRTLASARCLAGQFKNAQAVTIRQIGEILSRVDIAFFSTSSSGPVLTAKEAGYYLTQRKNAILMIDLAVPRDVESQVGELANVELVNIEQLSEQIENNRQARADWIEPAQQIIAQHTEQFMKWLDSLDMSSTVAQVTKELLTEAQRYTGRYRRYFSKKDQKRLEEFAEGLARKLMHRPIQYLKNSDNDKAQTAELVGRLFLPKSDPKAKL